MQEMTYEIEYKLKKNSSETLDTEITFELEDYIDSYSENLFHLSQNYSAEIVNQYTYDDKVDFLKKIIREQIGEVFVSKAVLNSLIEEIDNAVENYFDDVEDEDF